LLDLAEGVTFVMKSLLLTVAIVTGVMFTIGGCADQSSTAQSTANPTDRTYNRRDLQRTGENTTGGAVQKLDPSAQVTSGR
jgi:hypothetical protein